MKKCMFLACLIGMFVGGMFCFYDGRFNLEKDIENLYQEFENNELLDVNGEVNLVGVKSEHESLLKEVKDLFQQDKIEVKKFLEELESKKESNVSLKNEMENLSSQVSSLENKIKELSSQYSVLINKYNQLQKSVSAQSTTITTADNGFPLINQYPNYPTGCESVALTMLLRYYGVNVTPNNIIDRLKKEPLPYNEGGVRYGGNPELGFVGNPYSSASYGVYERPIADVANMYKPGIQVRNDFPFQEVLNLVQNKHPVMVWVSMGLSVPYISTTWIYKPTMETISWKAGEHAMIVLSYQDNTIVVADPIGGKIKSFSRTIFEQRYNYFGRKALYYL